MRFFTRVVVACLVAIVGHSVDVEAHARLVAPAPWNTQPSKQQVCGVTAANATPAKYAVSRVNANAPLIVSWEVVIADGRGPLTATLDTTASANPTAASFKVTLPVTTGTTNNPQAVSRTPYKISFQIPAGTVCTGPGETCTLRIASSSNWVACSTIKLVSGEAPPAPVTPPKPVDPNTETPVPTLPPPPVYPPATKPSNGAGGVTGTTQRLVGTKSGLTYLINAPTSTGTSATARGIIAFLHGSTASNFANGVNMFAKVASQYDLVRVSVLAPNGQGWNEGGAQAQVTAANSLLSLIQQDISTKYNIDQSKIFLTGQSSGAGFLSAYFVPLHADKIAGGVFLQCGAAPPAAATGNFAPTAATIKNLPLHFEITTGDTIWPTSYANALRAYTAAGMKYTSLNTKPGGHCAFDQQQVVLDRIAPMLPKPLPPAIATPAPVTPTQPQPTAQTPVNPTQKPADTTTTPTATQKPADTDTDTDTTLTSGDTFTLDGSVFTIAGTDSRGVAPFSASATTTARCVIATGLKTCSKVNGQSVQILTTADLMAVDANAQVAIDFGLNERSVISTTPSVGCRQAYADLICSQHFTPCGATTSTPQTCQATCRSANLACTFNATAIAGSADTTTTHASMYDCTKEVYGQIYADANGACSGAPPAILDGGDTSGAAQLQLAAAAAPVAILLALASSLMALSH